MIKIKVLVWNILIFSVLLSSISFSNKYLKEGYEFSKGETGFGGGYIITDDNPKGKHAFEYTLEDASEITKSGNPLDVVVAYKEDEERTGKIDGVYQDVGLYDYSYDGLEVHTIIDDLRDVHGDIKYNLNNNIIPKDDNDNYIHKNTKVTNITNIIIYILLIIFIVLFIVKRNKVFLILSIVLFLYGMISVIIINKVEKKYNYVENYILGVSNHHISKDIDTDKILSDMRDKLKSKYNISNLINDYIVKLNSCINVYNKNEELSEEEYDTYDIFGYSSFSGIFDITGNPENDFFDGIALYKYNEYDSVKNYNSFDEMLSNEIQKEGIFFEDMLKIYNYIKKDSQREFSNLANNIMKNITFNIPEENELLFHYLARIVDSVYVCYSHKYYDNSVISYFKDWYIDGDSRDIELPYGVILEYREPEFVKKDIKEIVYTNEQELDHDSKEKQVYVMYYRDSDGKLGASYTDIEFTKIGSDYEVSFNPVDLMYDIKKPTVKLVVK